MCLEKIHKPTEEEQSKVYIGYKIVQKNKDGTFKPTFSRIESTCYKIGEETISSRSHIDLNVNEIAENEAYEGIHFYTNPEVEKYPFDKDSNYALIKIEARGSDIVAFGEGLYPHRHRCPRPCPCPHPRRCPYPYRYPCRYTDQAVAMKVKVLEEITNGVGSDVLRKDSQAY